MNDNEYQGASGHGASIQYDPQGKVDDESISELIAIARPHLIAAVKAVKEVAGGGKRPHRPGSPKRPGLEAVFSKQPVAPDTRSAIPRAGQRVEADNEFVNFVLSAALPYAIKAAPHVIKAAANVVHRATKSAPKRPRSPKRP